jgi:hypothetical protein
MDGGRSASPWEYASIAAIMTAADVFIVVFFVKILP